MAVCLRIEYDFPSVFKCARQVSVVFFTYAKSVSLVGCNRFCPRAARGGKKEVFSGSNLESGEGGKGSETSHVDIHDDDDDEGNSRTTLLKPLVLMKSLCSCVLQSSSLLN